MTDPVLVVDAMAIHKGTFWDPKNWQYVGNVNFGTAVTEACENPATEALVFLAVGPRGFWKHSIAYVLQNKCSAKVQAWLISDCISLLHAEEINVHGVVFNGAFTNQWTATLLGCNLDVDEMKTWFQHPQAPGSHVYVIFDVCHMIKLGRNLFGDFKTIQLQSNGELKLIQWCFLKDLNAVQEMLGFSFAYKLKKKHSTVQKHKIHVNLTVQTLSNSLADVINFLHDELAHSKFQGSGATVEFIRKIDVIFDLLNNKNPFLKGTKAPMTLTNFSWWSQTCDETCAYLLSLRDCQGNLLYNGKHKSAICGVVFSMQSIKSHCMSLIDKEIKPIQIFPDIETVSRFNWASVQ